MLSMKDPRSAIADGTPRSHYYTYSLFNLAFGEAAVSTDVTVRGGASSECGAGLHAYGSRFAAGDAGLFMVNTGSIACRITLSVDEGKSLQANGWILRGEDPMDTTSNGVEWNGNVGTATASLDHPVDDNYERYVVPHTTPRGGRRECTVAHCSKNPT